MSERLYLESYKRSDKRNISSQSLKLNKSLNNSKSLKLERLKHKQFLEIKQINLITKKHFKISITELLSQSSPRDWISLDNWINFVILIRWRIRGRAGRCRQLEQRNVDISVSSSPRLVSRLLQLGRTPESRHSSQDICILLWNEFSS